MTYQKQSKAHQTFFNEGNISCCLTFGSLETCGGGPTIIAPTLGGYNTLIHILHRVKGKDICWQIDTAFQTNSYSKDYNAIICRRATKRTSPVSQCSQFVHFCRDDITSITADIVAVCLHDYFFPRTLWQSKQTNKSCTLKKTTVSYLSILQPQ